MAQQRLFLLDGMALAYRAHFAFITNPITNSKGVNTSAIYGFANTVISIIDGETPSHLAVVFDTSAPTTRHEMYPEYKAQRDAMPEDLSAALPNIKKLCAAMNIPVIELDGYEADDIIGTFAKMADLDGNFETFMVTPDKDFAQLVSGTTSMWKPGRKGAEREILDLPEILAKWEIEAPEQVIDILALWGDAVDNIPGVPGVGEKTAKKLVAQFGSVENLLENTDQLKGKQKENVENNKEQALMSKTLAAIITDVPVTQSLSEFKRQEPNTEELTTLFGEWEFRTLAKRILGKAAPAISEASDDEPAPVLKTLADFPHQYTLIETAEQETKLFSSLGEQDRYCFDLETTGLNRFEAQILGIAFCWKQGEAYYLPYREELQEPLQALFNTSATKIGHNLKFDLSILLNHGLTVAPNLLDTMLVHALVAPGQKHGMDALAETELGYQTIKLTDLPQETSSDNGDLFAEAAPKKSTKKSKEIDMRAIPQSVLAEYACEDVDITWQLAEKLEPELEKFGMKDLYHNTEAPLLSVLTEIEMEGISISEESLAKIRVELQDKIDTLTTSITKAAGREFNIKSPKQLGEILFGEMELVEKPKKTKTGQYVTNEQTLSALAHKHPIVADILEYRECTKLKSTYVDALPTHLEPKTNRIHTSLHQLQTSTGRLASSDPNLQNIPVRSEAGRSIRKAFVPRSSEFTILACDYSQIELRVMAAISEDVSMIKAFKHDHDIHTETAAKVIGVPVEEVTREMRSVAKMVNFGIIYGISAFGLSQRLDIPRKEAGQIIEAYFEEYPHIKAFMENTVTEARERGYTETVLGRRRYMPDLNSSNGMTKNNAERAAINTPIQGSAADMIKVAMVKVQNHLKENNTKTKMLLQVHDELLFDLHQDEHHLIEEIKEIMETALPLPHDIPAKVEHGLGANWLEAH